MKKYKLEKWHLGLPEDIEVGQEVSYTKERERNHGFIHWRVGTTTFKWSMSPEKIINNEFWSRIRPLFKTSGDGVEVYPKDKVLLIAHLKTELGDIGVSQWTAQQIVDGWNPDEVLTYYSREKAEEYRWKNSKLYSYNDIANGIELYGLDILKELSKKKDEMISYNKKLVEWIKEEHPRVEDDMIERVRFTIDDVNRFANWMKKAQQKKVKEFEEKALENNLLSEKEGQ